MAALQTKDKNKLKIVVRGLPPQLTEQTFQSSIEKWQNSIDFFYYAPGRQTEKKSVNSRAYLNFKSLEELQQFGRAFDGHTFVSNKGKEQKARVEFAPFQRVLSKTKKRAPDARENTIFEDPDYIQFVESLKEPIKSLPSAEEQLDKRLAEQKELEAAGQTFQTTPLLEYLKQKRAQKLKRGDRAERRKRAKDRERVGGKEIIAIAVNPNKKLSLEDKKRKEKNPSRRREREERRKKKDGKNDDSSRPDSPSEGIKDKPKKEQTIAKLEDDKRGKNGSWQIKKIQEPGAIAIQPKDTGQDQADLSPEQRNPRLGTNSNIKKVIPRRGGRGEVKIYAPKAQASPISANNGV